MRYLMKLFDDLTKTAQFRRLASLAHRALRDYDLGEVSLSPLQYVQNATWSVRCHSSQRYVLRVHAPRWHDIAAIRSELLWLEALRSDGFIVSAPVRTVRRGLWTTACAEGVPEARICTLMIWVPGWRPHKRRTPTIVHAIGRLMARLHEHASQFRIPEWFVRPRWDHSGVFRRAGEAGAGWNRLTRRQERRFQAVSERVGEVMERLGTDPSVFGLIHADLIFANVLFHGGEACAIDFDDCGFGYFLYDMAILLDRIEMRQDYPSLRAALLDGYRQVRPLAAEHEAYLDLFLLARWVFLGVCFLSRPEFSNYAPRFLKIVEPKMERYLRAGKSKIER
jgi:Ser/Thr protein kinase RdoA (MazF antagonist)